jgi:hypothetical protein
MKIVRSFRAPVRISKAHLSKKREAIQKSGRGTYPVDAARPEGGRANRGNRIIGSDDAAGGMMATIVRRRPRGSAGSRCR